jgi:hypothetical protein
MHMERQKIRMHMERQKNKQLWFFCLERQKKWIIDFDFNQQVYIFELQTFYGLSNKDITGQQIQSLLFPR